MCQIKSVLRSQTTKKRSTIVRELFPHIYTYHTKTVAAPSRLKCLILIDLGVKRDDSDERIVHKKFTTVLSIIDGPPRVFDVDKCATIYLYFHISQMRLNVCTSQSSQPAISTSVSVRCVCRFLLTLVAA